MKTKRHLPLKKAMEARLRDAEFRFYFEESRAISELCSAVVRARQARGVTQAQLAKEADTTQSVIARLEGGNNGRMPSLDLLNRIAGALRMSLVVGFEERKKAA